MSFESNNNTSGSTNHNISGNDSVRTFNISNMGIWQQPLKIPLEKMNNVIMDYLVLEGFKEAAAKFQQEAGVEPAVELDTLDKRILIREAVQSGRIQEATHLVNQLHPELLDSDRYLFFHLQQLHLIELIRNGKIEDALTFAQAHLAEAGENNPDVLSELERTMALLAFENPQNSPFADLLLQSHRQKVASELNEAILVCENQKDTRPKMVSFLQLVLWAQEELDKKNINFPKMTDLATAQIEYPK